MKRSRIHGWGLFAAVSFEVGDLVIEYVGEVIGNCISDIREKMYEVRLSCQTHTKTHIYIHTRSVDLPVRTMTKLRVQIDRTIITPFPLPR